MTWLDAAGWFAAALLLAAYALVALGRRPARARSTQALNIVGSALLAASSFARGALPSATLNVLWLAIAALAATRRSRSP